MKKWNANIQIPTGSDYVVIINDVKFGVSNSSGNPMLTVSSEIKSPSEFDGTVYGGNESVNIAGVKLKPNYYPTTVFNIAEDGSKEINADKTKSSRDRIMKDLLTPLGIIYEDVDWNNPKLDVLKGKAWYVMLECDIVERRATPTTAEIEASRKAGKRVEGKVLTNPVTKQPLVDYWPEIKEIFGLCPEHSVDAAY